MLGNVRVDGLVDYTRGQLECLAADLLRKRVDVPFRAPINVEVLLENTPDVHIEDMRGLREKYSVEGAVCTEDDTHELTVLVDYHLMNGPDDAGYNAVIAEEFAHIILHRAVIQQIKSIDDFIEFRKCPQWKQIELDARGFSAAVRMPEQLIMRRAEAVYPEVVDEHGFGDPHSIAKLVRNRLAEIFVTPVADMHARLVQWPCPVAARVIASADRQSAQLLPAPCDDSPRYSQRRLIDS
jgi:hypothetical protein